MSNPFNLLRDITMFSTIFRLVLAFICGGLIGLERSYKNRPAGIRTHILVCSGAAIASVTGLYLYLKAGLPTDMSRLGAQVVSGLGFIGAGTIIVTKKNTIKGLTTAAGLWTTGIIGLAIGAGFYEGALIATGLVLVTETLFTALVARIQRTPEFTVSLYYQQKTLLDQVLRYCKDKRLHISNLQVISNDSANNTYNAAIKLHPRRRINKDIIISHIQSLPGIYDVEEL